MAVDVVGVCAVAQQENQENTLASALCALFSIYIALGVLVAASAIYLSSSRPPPPQLPAAARSDASFATELPLVGLR